MPQYWKPVIQGTGIKWVRDQFMGFWVRKDTYITDMTEQLEKFNTLTAQKESEFFDELDRLESTNKELHMKLRELRKGVETIELSLNPTNVYEMLEALKELKDGKANS